MAEKILVTGVAGQLGYDVVKELNKRNIECRGVDIADFDLTDRSQVVSYIKEYQPTAIIHCAAYTAVDKAEEEYDKAYAVNAMGTSHIAEGAKAVDAKLLYISTDYVFNGEKEGFYDASDEKDPIGAYGSTKYAGEMESKKYVSKLFVVRLSWVFGKNGHNFVKTMLRLSEEREEIGVVADQVGSPTYTPDASKVICDIVLSDRYGEYNVANEGYCSWYDFTVEIMKQTGKTTRINPLTSDQYPTKTKRPKNSRFSKRELDDNGFERLPSWQDALARFLKELEV